MKDREWIDQATLGELRDAIRQEPPTSELFQGELGNHFWETYRLRMEELYSRANEGMSDES